MRQRHLQDTAWAINQHLVKHSGTGRAAVLVGGSSKSVGGSI